MTVEAWTGQTIRETWSELYVWLTEPLFTLGQASFSTANLLKILLFVAVLVWVARTLRRLLKRRVFPRFGMEIGVADALANIVGYTVLALGSIVGLQTAGIELSTLAVLFGALGVGVGIGLQHITSNFVSGLIILMERPIQAGDRVQVQDLHGRVVRIRMRATEILTNDNIAVIVPNSEFITQQVINWSRGGNHIRVHVPVGVAYGSDPDRVRQALLEAAESLDVVLKTPKPLVRMSRFGDSSLDFELLAWTSDLLHQRGAFISDVNFAIHDSLKRHGIQIPFPQRDVHLKTAPTGVTAAGDGTPRTGGSVP